MRTRRPLAALVVALALVGGGGSLAGCTSTENSNTGIPGDTIPSTATSSGIVPHNSDQQPNEAPERGGGGNTNGKP